MDEVDYSLYPKREHQLKFIAVYLEEAAKLRGTVWCDAASSLVQFEIIFNFQHIYNFSQSNGGRNKSNCPPFSHMTYTQAPSGV